MDAIQWVLEAALTVLLAATLFHAVRLERALGVIKRDRAELEALVRSFNDSTRQAESGIVRLRDATEGAGRHITRQITAAAELKNELGQLVDRAEDLSDRLAGQIRPARVPAPSHLSAVVDKMGSDQSMTDRTLSERRSAGRTSAEAIAGDAGLPRVRSQAERDLLRALRVAR